jgi:hypothetical protein
LKDTCSVQLDPCDYASFDLAPLNIVWLQVTVIHTDSEAFLAMGNENVLKHRSQQQACSIALILEPARTKTGTEAVLGHQ